jgi:hypothetical protein
VRRRNPLPWGEQLPGQAGELAGEHDGCYLCSLARTDPFFECAQWARLADRYPGGANRSVYVAIGVHLDGESDVLGLWLGPSGGEGAKQWMSVLPGCATVASWTL